MEKNAECPVCAAAVALSEDTVQGELITCPECGVELEVISLEPPQLAEAPQEEEDWGE
jgi:alpha-aminoadipate carrier protein LysW